MNTRLIKTALPGIVWLLSLFSCSSEDPVPQPLPEPTLNASDSLVLTELYKAFEGEKWAPPGMGWDLTDIHTWGGVSAVLDSVHNEYRVFKVILNQPSWEFPQGYISERIGDLPYLMDFRVGGRGLRGPIPESLFKLPFLLNVRIAGTSISGEIPDYVFQCPSLLRLDLCGNYHYGEVPDAITLWNNPEATCLLRENDLSGEVPAGIKIKELDLSNNDFTEFPFEYCFNDYPRILMTRNPFSVDIPDSVLNNPDAVANLYAWTHAARFPNIPDWWYNGGPPDPEETENFQAAQASRTAAPIRTRIELRTDIPLPGR